MAPTGNPSTPRITICSKIIHPMPVVVQQMNQFRRVIYKPHCHLARHAFSPKSGNLSNSQTMKTQVAQPQHFEEVSPFCAKAETACSTSPSVYWPSCAQRLA